MKKRKKNLRAKAVSLILVFLMFFSGSLTLSSDTVRAYSTDAYPLHYDIPITIVISPENANTPDPGQQVFHFRIWSDVGTYMEISNNKVQTNGFGTFEGHLTFSVRTHEEAEGLCSSTLRIQQYDGNENWQFDTHPVSYYFDYGYIGFKPEEAFDGSNNPVFYNTYRPVTPPPQQRVNYTIPLNVNIRKASEATPNPGQAVFHFRIWSDSGAALEITNNAIVTNGLGEFRANLSFSVAPEQVDAFEMALLHVQQYDGNADWQFDMYTFTFIYGEDIDANPCFYRDGREGENAPYGMAYNVYVTNTYVAAPPAPQPVEPVQPEEPSPDPDGGQDNEPSADPDGGQDGDSEFDLRVRITLNKTYAPRNGQYYYAGEPVVLWVNVRNQTDSKNFTDVYVYDEDGKKMTYDSHLYFESMAGNYFHIAKLLPYYSYSYMYYHIITPEEALAGKYVFSCHASGKDSNGDNADSNTATFEVKTSGVYNGKNNSEEKNPKKTRLTIELRESSQPEHGDMDYEYYIPGETIRYKVVIKNETGKTFYNIKVRASGDGRTYFVRRLMPGRTRTLWFSNTVTRRHARRGIYFYYATVMYEEKDGTVITKRTPKRDANVGTQE